MKLKFPHPGLLLRSEFMEALDLTPYRVAKECGIAHSAMSQILSGKRAITVETALRLGRYFGTSAQFWMNLQTQYDMRQASRALSSRIEREVKPLKLAVA